MRSTSRWWIAAAGVLLAPASGNAASWEAVASEPCPSNPARCVMLVDLETGARVDPARVASASTDTPDRSVPGIPWSVSIPAAVLLGIGALAAIRAVCSVRLRALDVELEKVALREHGSKVRRLATKCDEILALLASADVQGDSRVAESAEPLREAVGRLKEALGMPR